MATVLNEKDALSSPFFPILSINPQPLKTAGLRRLVLARNIHVMSSVLLLDVMAPKVKIINDIEPKIRNRRLVSYINQLYNARKV